MVYYFDSAATTKVHPGVVDAMLPAFSEHYGNPSGAHSMARGSQRLVDDARESLASLLDVNPGEVIFTSGGTEADNFAINGSAKGDALPVCTAVEHHAVLSPVEALGGTVLGVDKFGVVNLDEIKNLTEPPSVVSVMAANNEVGAIQPISEIAALVKEKFPQTLFHVDGVQGFCWLDMVSICEVADMVSLSAHKFGGPKGVGALIVKKGYKPAPQIIGGSQERERRAGTHNVPGIIGMAAAAEITAGLKQDKIRQVGELRNKLVDQVVKVVPDSHETAANPKDPSRANKIANIAHFCFEGVESEALLFLLERAGIMASAASSCASGAMEPSHVLSALGYSRELAGGSLRLSLGYETTEVEVDYVISELPKAVEQIRGAKK